MNQNNIKILKERNVFYKSNLCFTGITLLIMSIISLIFFLGFNNYAITAMYLLPIYLLLISIYLLYITNKEKNTLTKKTFSSNLIEGVLLLCLIFFLFLVPVTTVKYFIELLGCIFIFKSIITYLKYDKHIILENIYLGFLLVMGIIFIVFQNTIVDFFLYVIILIIIIAVKNLILCKLISKEK